MFLLSMIAQKRKQVYCMLCTSYYGKKNVMTAEELKFEYSESIYKYLSS